MAQEQTDQTLPVSKKAKLKAVELLGKSLDKTFETKGTFQMQGKKVGEPIPSIPTHLPTVDRGVLGAGGLPQGRIVEVYGVESSGKTAFASHVIGCCQKAGGLAAFIDAEHALDPTFASKLGVNMDELVVSQPDCGEQALDIVEALVDSGIVDLIVVDSVSALVPRAELEGDMGDSHMGLQARLMSQAMRKLVGKVSKKKCTVIFINQTREKIGLVFGDPTTTSGGKALKFAASVRLEFRRVAKGKGGEIIENEVIVGHKINIKSVKNKVGPPFKETQVTLFYETGFDTQDDIINHALKIGVLTGTAWIQFDGKGDKYRREDLLDKIDEIVDNIEKYYEELSTRQPMDFGGTDETIEGD